MAEEDYEQVSRALVLHCELKLAKISAAMKGKQQGTGKRQRGFGKLELYSCNS
jgi:hypothetical protein